MGESEDPRFTCEECDYESDSTASSIKHALGDHEVIDNTEGTTGVDLVEAEAGVAFRAAALSAVGYGIWSIVSGSGFSVTLYLKIALVLFILGNVVFWLVKWYRPDMLDQAQTVEENL